MEQSTVASLSTPCGRFYYDRMDMEHVQDSREALGSSDRVYFGIMSDLENGRMVPGQRLAETELAARYSVGRNAVREAVQRLAVRGIIDLARFRSPAIRSLDVEETMEILEVAKVMTALVVRTAADRYDEALHAVQLAAALTQLESAHLTDEPGQFGKARRNFYRILLVIGDNRELQRLFPAIGMHIIYAQFQSRELREIRLADYRRIIDAVRSGDGEQADFAAAAHVANVRKVILKSSRL